jgi:hypothetical protein
MYNLQITEQQANIIAKALDVYVRLGIGQVDNALKDACDHFIDRNIDVGLLGIKKLITGFDCGSSWGIHNEKVPSHFKNAYDIFFAIKHKFAVENNSDGVYSFKKNPVSSEGYPGIERV